MNNSRISKLKSLCRAGISINIDDHKQDHLTITEYVDNLELNPQTDLPRAIKNKIIELDTIVDIQVYPKNTVGFYNIYHYDVDVAIDTMIKYIEKELYLQSK